MEALLLKALGIMLPRSRCTWSYRFSHRDLPQVIKTLKMMPLAVSVIWHEMTGYAISLKPICKSTGCSAQS